MIMNEKIKCPLCLNFVDPVNPGLSPLEFIYKDKRFKTEVCYVCQSRVAGYNVEHHNEWDEPIRV